MLTVIISESWDCSFCLCLLAFSKCVTSLFLKRKKMLCFLKQLKNMEMEIWFIFNKRVYSFSQKMPP